MIYALVGKTCSGKSTAFKKLLDLGYETTISYTTRPQRSNETNGKEYNFISVEEFKELNDKDLIVAPRVFNDWFYGMNLLSIEPSKKQIVIVDPKGFRDLVHDIGERNVTGIYLTIPSDVQLLRGLNRKDNLNELFRRIHSDEADFKDLELEIDHTISSLYKQQAFDQILEIIEGRTTNE